MLHPASFNPHFNSPAHHHLVDEHICCILESRLAARHLTYDVVFSRLGNELPVHLRNANHHHKTKPVGIPAQQISLDRWSRSEFAAREMRPRSGMIRWESPKCMKLFPRSANQHAPQLCGSTELAFAVDYFTIPLRWDMLLAHSSLWRIQ